MTICNKELIKTIKSDELDPIEIDSDINIRNCQNRNENADMMDFRVDMDQVHFYEKTDFEPCKDLWMIDNEECLWQCIVGEVKTPFRALSNSLGQYNYGCRIWEKIGQRMDDLDIKEFESYIIETCLKYPEVRNVIDIDTKIGEQTKALLCEIVIDSIYGTFTGVTRIPQAKPTRQNWVSNRNYSIR